MSPSVLLLYGAIDQPTGTVLLEITTSLGMELPELEPCVSER